jgi:hypothetical protein
VVSFNLRHYGFWLALMRPGDFAVVLLSAVLVAASFPLLWQSGSSEKAVVRRDGVVLAELPLTAARTITVAGAIGPTVIEVQPGRARVLSDPGPRQYCVKQGWLTRPNAVAICAPSHITLTLAGRSASHDSLSY